MNNGVRRQWFAKCLFRAHTMLRERDTIALRLGITLSDEISLLMPIDESAEITGSISGARLRDFYDLCRLLTTAFA